jgi:hypothetical protein
MLSSSATTRSEAAASAGRAIVAALAAAADRLGAAALPDIVGALLRDSFPLPADDRRYRTNSLLPGRIPLELSFSEAAPGALRLDLEPFGPLVSPATRREAAIAWWREAAAAFGAMAVSEAEPHLNLWWDALRGAEAHFGAFLGAVVDAQGLAEVKIYLELDPARARLAALPWCAVATQAIADLPGTEPHFVSISVGRGGGVNERLYHACRSEVAVPDLAPLVAGLGLAQAAPQLMLAALTVTGGQFAIPANGVVLGLRPIGGGTELKLDVMLPAGAARTRLQGLRQLHLARQGDTRALERWLTVLGGRPLPDLTVAGLTVGPDLSPRLSLYGNPAWLQPATRQGFA